MNNKGNNIHISKLITEMPMLKMNHRARLILYTVLKKIWLNFRSQEDYKPNKILTDEDYKFIQSPVVLSLSDFKPLFTHNISYKEIVEYILKVPKEAGFKTYYNVYGEKTNTLLFVVITFFEKIEFNNDIKKITFVPSRNILDYIEALKAFAIVDIEEMKKLRGNYQIRGYELICQNNYRDKNNKKLVNDNVRKIKMEDIRRYFEVPKTYDAGQIDTRIMKPLIKAVNKNTKYNIIEIKKFRLDPGNRKKVSHYRFDVEYKEEYLQSIKEKEQNNKIYELEEKRKIVEDIFKNIWNLYPLRKGISDITFEEKIQVCKIGIEEFKKYIDRYTDYVNERRKEFPAFNFMEGVTFFKGRYTDYTDQNYTKYKATIRKNNSNKPTQATNYEQREYDDEFFESLYDNF